MSNLNNYDPNEELPSPSFEVLNQMLSLPNIFDENKSSTPTGIGPSYHNSLDSLTQAITLSGMFPFENLQHSLDTNKCQHTYSCHNLETTLSSHNNFEVTLMNSNSKSLLSSTDIICHAKLESEDEKLLILAEPKAFYRDRYSCETDRTKNRAQRYIRADDNQLKYEYPTVKIPTKWCDLKRQIYIRVTSVTIKNELLLYHCIHPYEIDTSENNVIKDPENNSLYFRINKDEFIKGEKSFQISRKKMLQNDLKSYGPFRLFNSGQPDTQCILNSQDAKCKIATYQLKKSQFIFTIAERHNNRFFPIPILDTSVASQIIVDEVTDKRNSTINPSNDQIKCIPQKGDWQGDEEVLIIMSKPIKGKKYTICFDFGLFGEQIVNEITHIDTKIILFRTPPCPILPGDKNFQVSVIIKENNLLLSSIDFYYVTPMKPTINLCRRCQSNINDNRRSNKRRCEYDEYIETDNGESLISHMKQLSIEQKPIQSHIPISSNEKDTKFDKYLNQLKVALEKFVRTNDPSQLFRRTRILLSKCDENSLPLNDAIQRGHIEIALSLIEQVLDMNSSQGLLEKGNENGETPLLIAAKCNQWKLIEVILKNRSDLVEQKDKNDNNLLHLLANLNEDGGAENIKNIFKILSNDTKQILLIGKNKLSQTPLEIAQSHGNTQCIDMLNFSINGGKKSI
ncbi:unnamed protein product [Rotaria sordida]|uniref:Uncharacterized protein n=1 Tax=Rotaria sordida TaxID=392033 RepID=A0A814V2R4_9BILA|nr:unnamed protein product [Rotaria sordida]CAF1183462.1 unnamed protein product [Rotaria sordida]